MDFEFDNKIPIYIQVMDLIKKDIIKGILKEGDKLPSVRDLSSDLKVNPNTIQRSYQELERDGITYTQRGMGTFVTENKEIISNLRNDMAKNFIDSFITNMKDLGFRDEEILKVISKNLNKEVL